MTTNLRIPRKKKKKALACLSDERKYYTAVCRLHPNHKKWSLGKYDIKIQYK